MTSRRFTVPAGASVRLDHFLAHELELSHRALRAALEHARLTVNGRPGAKGTTVFGGDLVTVEGLGALRSEAVPNPGLGIQILYEDAHVVGVNKPPGIPSVAVRGLEARTVASFLLGVYPQMSRLPRGKQEAGLVHRLDTGTSGLLLAARTAAAYQRLRAAFAAGRARKHYVAVVRGEVARGGSLRAPLARATRTGRRVVLWHKAIRTRPLPAITHFRPVRILGGGTLLAVRIVTGVRHQIRVHLASLGHPVVGDTLYGGISERQMRLPGLLLHCHRLLIPYPTTSRILSLRAPLPAHWSPLVALLLQ